jgi:hypothetical protein
VSMCVSAIRNTGIRVADDPVVLIPARGRLASIQKCTDRKGARIESRQEGSRDDVNLAVVLRWQIRADSYGSV